MLKKTNRFAWTTEAQEALDGLKRLLTNTPILVPPLDGEPLLLYITKTTQMVSMVLAVEHEEESHTLEVQRPVYFVSEVLSDSKTQYLQIQKLMYVVLITKRKLRQYI